MAAASSDFDIFNLFDTDDIELSQLCEKVDTENNLINTADKSLIEQNDSWIKRYFDRLNSF
jgi:hypothetical protein